MSKKLLTTEEAASLLDRSPRTLANWRAMGIGPTYIAGGKVRYSPKDIRDWLEGQKVGTKRSAAK